MTAAILGIVAALVPLIVWLVKRRAARTDDPAQKHQEHYESIDREIATGDTSRAPLASDLDALERWERLQKRARDPVRPNGNASEGR